MKKKASRKRRRGNDNPEICSRERGGAGLDWLVDARARFGPRHQAAFDEDGYVLMPRLLSVEGLDYVRGKVAAIHRGVSRAETWPSVHMYLLSCAPCMLWVFCLAL